MKKNKIAILILLFFLSFGTVQSSFGDSFWGGVNRSQLDSESDGLGADMIGVYNWASTKLGAFFRGKYVIAQSISDQGGAGTAGTIAYIINAIGSNYATIEVTGDYDYLISTSLVIPANITLDMNNGAVFVDDANNADLTINGKILAGENQKIIFWGNGAGTVSVGNNILTPKNFGAVGDGVTDDSEAMQETFNSCKNIYIPDGTYLINGAAGIEVVGMEIQSNTLIEGQGPNAILLQGTIRFLLTSGTHGEGDESKENITVRNLTLKNNAGTFSEQRHLMVVKATSNMLIENVRFIGFQGDALNIRATLVTETENHNYNITVRNCLFDGVNNENRQGISISDVDGLYIEKSKFINTTRFNMPGNIDIEPASGMEAYVNIKNININNCEFRDYDGFWVFGIFLAYELANPIENIKFTNNHIHSGTCSNTIYINTAETIDEDLQSMGIEINNNYIVGSDSGPASVVANIQGVKGFQFIGNTLKDTNYMQLGEPFGASSQYLWDALIKDNILEGDTYNIRIGTVKRFVVDNNIMKLTGASSSTGILFAADSGTITPSEVSITNNKFIAGPSQLYAINVASSGVALDSDEIRFFGNNLDGLSTIRFDYNNNEILLADLGGETVSSVLSILPDTWRVGQSWNIVNGDTAAPDVSNQGILITHKYNETSGYRKFITQWYYPANNGAMPLANMYFRKSDASTNAWSSWYKITGS